jgi:xylulokinase
MPLVVGVDSSTSACKVEVRDADTGELVGFGRASHPATESPRSEQDPNCWWDAFQAASAQAGLVERNRPAAISVAGQQHGLVVLGAKGEVLRPAKLWNDTESAGESEDLIARLGPAAWSKATGSIPVSSFTITKVLWLRHNEPDTYRRMRSMLLPHDWLTMQLTGRCTTDRGDASGTGWWSPAEDRYRPDLLGLVDDSVAWEGFLPEVLSPTSEAGRWIGHEAMVGPGTGDNMAAALGLGLEPGDLALSLGTSGTAFTVAEQASADPTGVVAGFADATGRFLPLVCTLNATKVTDTVGRWLGVDAAGLDSLALAARADPSGPLLIPHLDGERTPNLPHATGTLSGIRSDTTREQLARAAVEGVVCNLLDAADHLPGLRPDGQVLLVGGGARGMAYRQTLADLLGRTVLVPRIDEIVARGAALQAAVVLTGRKFSELSAEWGSGPVDSVSPSNRVDRQAIRERYMRAVADGSEPSRGASL